MHADLLAVTVAGESDNLEASLTANKTCGARLHYKRGAELSLAGLLLNILPVKILRLKDVQNVMSEYRYQQTCAS